MAQLRDERTSSILFEGTPLACALAAQKLGEKTMFDDVGAHFNPDEVLKAAEDNLAGLEQVAAEDDSLADAARQAAADLAPPDMGPIRTRLEEARRRHAAAQ